MTSREQFEAQIRLHTDESEIEERLKKVNGGLNYAHPETDVAWIWWQASREAVELDIDWPEANDDTWKDGEEGAYAMGHEDGKDKVVIAVRKAIRTAGIKVKGG